MAVTERARREAPESLRVFHPTVVAVPSLRTTRDSASSRLCTVRAADSDGHRSSANILVDRMYAWRGYGIAQGIAANRDQNGITLLATERDSTVGTLSVGFDHASGLMVDELFPDEAEHMRLDGAVLCEFTKLAVDRSSQSKAVLASMFHMAFLYAHEIHRCDRIVIEVNPRHVRYYERMLGFVVRGSERNNLRVNAPAVLLSLELSHARRQIDRFGGQPGLASAERSLYPYFFSHAEELGIVRRLLNDSHELRALVPAGHAHRAPLNLRP